MLLSTYFERRLNKNVDKNLCAKISFSLLLARKLSLVNETLRPETETRPRPRHSHISPRPRRDRDVEKMRLETVSRPRRRDWDYIPAW